MEPKLEENTDPAHPPIHPISSVLVVGGCGFLGHHIVWQILLRHKDAKIAVLDLKCRNNRFSDGRVTYHDGDITNSQDMEELFGKLRPEVVIHTASPHFGERAKGAHDLLYKVNVDGTKVLLDVAKNAGTKAFVYTSSAGVVMKRSMVFNEGIVNADEESLEVADRSDQWDWYNTTKGLAENSVLDCNSPSSKFLTCAIRPAMIYGEGEVQVLPYFLQAARRGQWRFQLGNNDNLVDTTYGANAAIAHLLAAEALLYSGKQSTVPIDVERVDGEAFFVSNDAPIPFWSFARAAWKEAGVAEPLSKVWVLGQGTAYWIGTFLEGVMWCLGRQPKLTRDKVMFSCLKRYYCIDKAKTRLGYRPVVGFEEGIRRAVRDIDERGMGGLPHANGTAVGSAEKIQAGN